MRRATGLAMIAIVLGAAVAGCGGAASDVLEAPDRGAQALATARPEITAAPADTTVAVGQRATFRVEASAGATKLRYQWHRNGKPIAGAERSSYTTAALSLADDGDAYTATVRSAAGATTSAAARLSVARSASPLADRSWRSGELLVRSPARVVAGIDDAGRVMLAYTLSIDGRIHVYARRARAAADDAVPSWGKPVELNVLDGQLLHTPLFYGDIAMAVAPNGNAYLTWVHELPCTAQTYAPPPSSCKWLYGARYRADADRWEAPERIADTPSSEATPRINAAGDVAVLYVGWKRTPDGSTYDRVPAAAWRAAKAPAFELRRFDAPRLADISRRDTDLALDAAGRMVVAGEFARGTTSGIAAVRGSVHSGFGAAQTLDSGKRGKAAFERLAMGIGSRAGSTFVAWERTADDGTARHIAATSADGGKTWSTADLGPFDFDDNIDYAGFEDGEAEVTVDDAGVVHLYDFARCAKRRWSRRGWSAAEALPLTCPPQPLYGSAIDVALARNADALMLGAGGRWASYDASRGALARAFGGTSPGPGYLLGFESRALRNSTRSLLLAPNRLGAMVATAYYDALPTPARPEGDTSDDSNAWLLPLRARE